MFLENRKARHDYTIMDHMEAGIVLTGAEVKSLRLKRGSMHDAFVKILGNEVYVVNMLIQQYDFSPGKTYEATRSRKLLLHKAQIRKLAEYLGTNGLTAVPLMVGEHNHYMKVLIGIGKGKKQYDRKKELKERDLRRENDRAMKSTRS